MNFFLCNRCNKKSEDNILNFNSTEILLKNNNQNLINNSIIKKIDSIDQFPNDQFPNLNIGENIQTSMNNLNNLEGENDDELEIIEYPYSKKEKKIPSSKIKPKQFQNNKSKFFSPNLIEQDILKQLNNFGNTQKLNKNNTNSKKRLGRKITNNKIKDDELERKDTMTDPANMALSSLIQDINKKANIHKENNNEEANKNKDDEDEIITINDETENNYFILKNEDEKNVSEKEKNDRKNNFVQKNIKNKNQNQKIKNKNNLSNKKIKKYDNCINKITERKISQNKKISEYNSNIIKKKNLLKNKGVFSKNSTNSKNLEANLLSFSTRKQFPKSYSFNYASSAKRFNNLGFIKKGINYNELGNSLTLGKKKNNLYNNIFKVNEVIPLTNKNNNNKNKMKITHKKVSRAQAPIQKSLSSHISPYH